MEVDKINEVIKRVENGEVSKEELLVLLKALNMQIEAYKNIINEVKILDLESKAKEEFSN